MVGVTSQDDLNGSSVCDIVVPSAHIGVRMLVSAVCIYNGLHVAGRASILVHASLRTFTTLTFKDVLRLRITYLGNFLL